MRSINFFKATCLILSLLPLTTLAIPIKYLDRFVDNDHTTIDTVTGLEWLDLSVTDGIGFIAVEEQLGLGGAFEGYRHAWGSEILDVFAAFEIPPDYSQITDNVRLFMDLYGSTPGYGNVVYSYGHAFGENKDDYIPRNPRTGHPLVVPTYGMQWYQDDDTVLVSSAELWHGTHVGFEKFGSFLVRKYEPHTVPEIDAGTAPVALGLLLFTVLARRERGR